jgi:hypothetical protein
LTAEPDPGTSLERRADALPDLSVPNRAGAVVSEFVASIVQEAQAHAAEIIEAADQEAAMRRQTAFDGAARVREHVAFLANELPGLLSALRQEAERLSSAAGPSAGAVGPPDPSLGHDPEAEAIAQVRAGIERAELAAVEKADSEDAEGHAIVEGEGEGDTTVEGDSIVEGDTIVDAEVAADEGAAEAAEEQERRLTGMTDEELARAYANAIRTAAREHDKARAALLRGLAERAVEEALGRPAFAEVPEETVPRRRGLFGLRRRRRDVSFSSTELHDACRTARSERLGVE